MPLPTTFWRPTLADLYDEARITYDQAGYLYDSLSPVVSNTAVYWAEDVEDLDTP